MSFDLGKPTQDPKISQYGYMNVSLFLRYLDKKSESYASKERDVKIQATNQLCDLFSSCVSEETH